MVFSVKSDICLDREINSAHHLGHILLECLRKRKQDDICQIDAASGEQETYGSVLKRTIRLAKSMRKFGLQPGDVVTLAGKNHLDIRIPYFASLMNGLPVSGVHMTIVRVYSDLKKCLAMAKPKITFCENEFYEQFKQAAKDLNIQFKIVTFKDGDCTMEKFMKTYDDDSNDTEFVPAEFDTEKIYAWLPFTSGSTGTFKLAAIKHKDTLKPIQNRIATGTCGTPAEGIKKSGLFYSSPHSISGFIRPLELVLANTTIIQTSKPYNIENYMDVINKYRPSILMGNPYLLSGILKHEKYCDLTCFDSIRVSGSKVYKSLLEELKVRMREDAKLVHGYASTELVGYGMMSEPGTPIGSCGRPRHGRITKLVDPETSEEIKDFYKPGELLCKGPMFSEYYNNPEETAKVFTEDGWFRTGDLFYRDENYNYYFVDRLKLLIRYKDTAIFPTEVEEMIEKHLGVLEVCVTSIEHPIDGEWPVACVVRRPGFDVTAQEIKNLLIIDNFTTNKKLCGEVIFMDKLQRTPSGKMARNKIKEYVRSLKKIDKSISVLQIRLHN